MKNSKDAKNIKNAKYADKLPVKNQFYTLKIDDLSKYGGGVGKLNGFTVFVENVLPQETVYVKILSVSKSYAYAKLETILEPSPYRIVSECPYSQKCGGCSLQHLEYTEELKQKQKIVCDAFERIGGFKDINAYIRDIAGMKNPGHSRNKAQFPVCKNFKTDTIEIGFYAHSSHRIIDIAGCLNAHQINDEIIAVCRDFITQNNIEPYDEKSHSGLVRHIFTRIGFSTGEIMVCIIINGKTVPYAEKLVKELTKIDGMTSITLNINTEKTNVIIGEKIITLWGRNYIYDYIDDIKFKISPLSFYQVNPAQMKVLYKLALDMANPAGDNQICIDAYCGIGTISLYFAKYMKKVYGIEIVADAVSDAKENAELNGITNAEFILGRSEDEIPRLIQEEKITPNLLILDPPRKGCAVKLLDAISQEKIEKIIYISCDPATLARDVKYLCASGYKIEQIQPVEMFPRTMHVECIVLLSCDM